MRQHLAMILALTCLFTTNPAKAGGDRNIVLKPIPGHTSLRVENGSMIRGQCGGAVVTLLGVHPDRLTPKYDLIFEYQDLEDLRLWTGKKDVSLQYAIDGYNMVHCVETSKGDRLLVGSSCGGSLCIDAFAYHVINPRTGRSQPSRLATKSCYFECANRFLGKKYLSE